MSEITLYQHSSTGAVKYIKIWTEGNKLHREWGQVGTDKPQHTFDAKSGKNIGRSNETTPEEQAEIEWKAIVKKKMDAGYVKNLKDEVSSFDFDSPPKSFCPAKPVQKLPSKLPEKVILTRKRDGMRTLAFVDSECNIRLFSRRMDEVTTLFPAILGHLHSLGLPPETIIDGEMIFELNDGSDDFKTLSSIYRSKSPLAVQKTAENRDRGKLIFYTFDILFWNGDDMTESTYSERLELLPDHTHIQCVEIVTDSLKNAMKQVAKKGWEGLVVYDPNYKNTIAYDGKPKRPKGCWKSKPIFEDDFVITSIAEGDGKNTGRLGKVDIAQYNSDGELVPWGSCGGGFTDAQRDEFWKSWKNKIGKQVIEVKFDERLQDGLRFPVFLRERTDKTAEECIYD